MHIIQSCYIFVLSTKRNDMYTITYTYLPHKTAECSGKKTRTFEWGEYDKALKLYWSLVNAPHLYSDIERDFEIDQDTF